MQEQLNPNENFPNYKFMYKRLVEVLHPDKGGDHESMIELNKAQEEARNGDSSKLIKMYKEYIVEKNEIKIQNENEEDKK